MPPGLVNWFQAAGTASDLALFLWRRDVTSSLLLQAEPLVIPSSVHAGRWSVPMGCPPVRARQRPGSGDLDHRGGKVAF